MKKKVIGLALMAMALVGFNGMAQDNAQNSKQCCKSQTECPKGIQKAPKMNPYEGLTLTDAQKSKLAELDSKRMADHKAKMEARKAEKKDQKNADKAKKAADKKALMEARKAEKMEYLKEVKAIIGPDQYVVFLENFYVNGGGNHGDKKAFMQGKSGKKGMAHNKGNKDRKGQRKGGDRKGANRNGATSNAQS